MFDRAKYRSHSEIDWRTLKDPVATVKYDGANYFLPVEADGSLRFFSRRESVKGGFPERTQQLPHLTNKKLPGFAGQVFNVELIHSGFSPYGKESHREVSGILNSLKDRSIQTQSERGPVRAVLHNVITPELATYKGKLVHMKALQDAFGDPKLLRVAEPSLGHVDIHKLIEETKLRGHEGVIITSLTTPEDKNTRVKIKHIQTFNLLVVDILQEVDKDGKLKDSAGALVVADRSGRIVANVGTGFSKEQRYEIWHNKPAWIHRLIQVKTMGLSASRLRMPVYNGDADGELDLVE